MLALSRSDNWELCLSRKESRPVVRTPFVESGAKFSPDARWIAYQSDESGRDTGRELFYQTATAMFAVPILDAHDLHTGPPVRLFENARVGRAPISVDGPRFLMLKQVEANDSSQLRLVQNWLEDVTARVAGK